MSKPVKSWAAVARILGVSYDTLWRHRKQHGDRTVHPWFRDEEEAIAWYRALIAPPPVPVAPARKPRAAKIPPREKALDVKALIRELTKKGE